MPATNFVRGSNPVWSFVDLVGKQFDDTFYLWILENQIPYVPSTTVFHDPSGTLPWESPIRFSAAGTLSPDIFFDDTKVYRLEFRHNVGPLPPSQADPLIYLVENYIPSGEGISPAEVAQIYTSNQISNPQFATINFDSPFTLTNVTNPPPLEIAPGWILTLQGTGSITIEQIPLSMTLSNQSNAPYALRLYITGPWANNPILSQTFSQNGMLWANQYVASSITGMSNAPSSIRTRLVASNGQPIIELATIALTTAFVEYDAASATPLPPTTNPNIPPDASISYQILLPTSGDVYLTSIQLVQSGVVGPVSYQQETVDRSIDQLFHYYLPQLSYKPIPSYLTGWDFPLNPQQFGTNGPFTTGVNTSNYVWDQTIIYQSIDSGFTASTANDGSLTITTNAMNPGQIALIQYLDGPQVQELLENPLSIYMRLKASLPIGGTISLWATDGPNLPSISAGNHSIVQTLDANGYPATRNGAWTEITRTIIQNQTFLIDPSANYSDLSMTTWLNTNNAIIPTSKYFAIVIGFANLQAGTIININSISLNKGYIATSPAPKTVDETLRDCERYYEMSYANPAQIAGGPYPLYENAVIIQQGATLINAMNQIATRINSFWFPYRGLKRALATPTFYSAYDGTINTLGQLMYYNTAVNTTNQAIARWTPQPGTKSCSMQITSTFSDSLQTVAPIAYETAQTHLYFHYITDARLGVVN